jgi:hypothetical protein
MPAKFSFVHADLDGEGRRWRLMVDAGDFLTAADETDTTESRATFAEHDEEIVGPFTVEQLLAGARQ